MKKTLCLTAAMFVALLAFVACGSGGSSDGSGGAPPSCQNPGATGAGSLACNSCLQASCSSQLALVESSCQAYITCYEGCQCTDVACVLGCQSKVDNTCSGPGQAQETCMQQHCSQPCTGGITVDAGAD
jgi:hypothetical protein